MGSPRVYRQRRYEFGQRLFALRTRLALTQGQLAEQIGVHWHSVQKWETGESYPKAETLQRLIALCLHHQAFTAGKEGEEAQSLWHQVSEDGQRRLASFDQAWFARTLALAATSLATPPTTLTVASAQAADNETTPSVNRADAVITLPEIPRAIIDLGEVIAVPQLVGRESELATLQQWVVADHCRVVAVVGLGGIGKSSLALTFAQRALTEFEVVLFRSLQNGPPLAAVLDHTILTVSNQKAIPPELITDKIALLVQLLRERRCLLILDNFESLMQPGALTGTYRTGYAEYGMLVQALSEREHHSCLVLTSREKPSELGRWESRQTPVRTLLLTGLADDACRLILEMKDIVASATDVHALRSLYGGNPLALHLVSAPIRDLFGGDVATFLSTDYAYFDGVHKLMEQHFARLTPLERTIVYWFAVQRELMPLDTLMARLGPTVPPREVLVALESLIRRGQVERGADSPTFTLQPMILEFVTEQIVDTMCQEIASTKPHLLERHALIQATAKDYVRRSQEQLIATPLLAQLTAAAGGAETAERQLLTLLESWRHPPKRSLGQGPRLQAQPSREQGYGPGNIINLLRLLRGNLRGLDLAQLAIRQANLQSVELHDASLAGATIQDSIFTETFDAILAVDISRNGEYWAASSQRGEVLIWVGGGLTLHRLWRAHTDMIWALKFSPDGRTLASGSWDGRVKVWDVASGALRWSGRHASHVNSVAFTPDGKMLASGGDDATVRLWDVRSGAQLQTLAHPGAVSGAGVTWSPDGRHLASGDLGGTIRLWEIPESGPAVCVQVLAGHTNFVDGLAFAPDGRTLVSTSWDGTVKLWDTSTAFTLSGAEGLNDGVNNGRLRLRQVVTGHLARIGRVAWSPDGRTLACGGVDTLVWLLDVEQGSYRASLRGHTDGITGLTFMPDGQSLLSSGENTLRVWNIANGQCMRVIQGYADFLYVVDWSPDGTRLVSGGMDRSVIIWDLTGETMPRILRGHSGAVCGVGWSSDGQWVASSEWDNVIRLWGPTSGACLQVLRHPDDPGNFFYGLAWSPDGQRLACGTWRRGVQIFERAADRQHWSGRGWVGREFPTWIRHVAWSPDGAQLAGSGDDGTVYVWDAVDGTLLQQLAGHHSMITSVAWSPDGTRLASGGRGSEGGELFVWNPQRGERMGSFAGHAEIVTALAWGPGKELLVSGGGGGRLRWWDVRSGECVRVVEAHQGTVQSLRRSPDGTKLASCSDDGAVLLWDLYTGEYLQTLRRDRPYERMDITGVTGLTTAQVVSLKALGAVETPSRVPPGREQECSSCVP